MTSKLITHVITASILVVPVFSQNLVSNGDFSDGSAWSGFVGFDNGWYHADSHPGSDASNLAYTPIAAAAYGETGGITAFFEDAVTDGVLSQSVSGLSSSASATDGDLVIWLDTTWINTNPDVSGRLLEMVVSLDSIDYAAFRTNDDGGNGTIGSTEALNGAILDSGSATDYVSNRVTNWIRHSITIPNYAGPDTAELAFTVNTNGDDFFMDNVIIAETTIPEPSSALLSVFALAFFTMHRRR